ncbi:phage tail protein I [Burkholderia pseudomallei]|uniref:phage tail protein I n=1 Tax=Burkholderia pseudomallei TaxID=28450 RepID=UPI00050ED1FF|nr:phage tail protein I [Burkholderia pseudomallei]KGD34049.1 phage tail protein I [Burkholderia pseudomallei]KGD54625.1 phage tail protein I [Burkholderia pseudomallei]KGS90895.1 phage tail protein I [Burkholderia pseudomallei MSHR5596]OMZ33295.1 phage tail protein [Burkholderia pseudomallei]QRM22246.1 phage tail protein I [Burkholderia pseudomallei]
MSERLLPSNQTPLEAALARVLRPSVDPEILRTLMDVDRCPAAFLPWLAWSVAVDGWELAESDDARRALIKGSLALHRRKGTPWAVREIVRRLGFGEIEIQEGRVAKRRDGTARRDGNYVHGRASAWAEYIVTMKQPITRGQGQALMRAIERYAPARSQLVKLDYSAIAIRHNGTAVRNGQYSRGVVAAWQT